MILEAMQKAARECVSCNKLTKYICADCLVDGKGFIPLCENSTCKEDHKSKSNCGLSLSPSERLNA